MDIWSQQWYFFSSFIWISLSCSFNRSNFSSSFLWLCAAALASWKHFLLHLWLHLLFLLVITGNERPNVNTQRIHLDNELLDVQHNLLWQGIHQLMKELSRNLLCFFKITFYCWSLMKGFLILFPVLCQELFYNNMAQALGLYLLFQGIYLSFSYYLASHKRRRKQRARQTDNAWKRELLLSNINYGFHHLA